jgi:plastocyanin
MNFRRLLAALLVSVATPVGATALSVVVHDAEGAPLDQAVVIVDAGLATASARSTAVIDQVNRMFVPHVSVVRTGTAVSFPNRDDIRHHLYSFSEAKTFELPLYKGTPAEPVIFDQAGIVTLACNIHDWMLGFVYVTDAPSFVVTGEDGRAEFELPAGTEYRVTVWHPSLGPESEGRVTEVPPAGDTPQTLRVELAAETQRGSRRLRRGPGRYR